MAKMLIQISSTIINGQSAREEMIGVIKDNKLVGLYHKQRCPLIYRELREHGGQIKTLNRSVKMTSRFYCRFCIYLEAEERGINCFDICPQKICLEEENLPEAMRSELWETILLTENAKKIYATDASTSPTILHLSAQKIIRKS